MAGIYASVELVGKIVYFLTASISTVMFPVIVQKRARKESYHKTFLLAIVLVLIPSLIITLLYFLYPDFVISIVVKKSSVIAYSYILGFFGVIMTLYSLVGLFIYFFLSINKLAVTYLILIAAIVQGILIWFFHKTFMEVLTVSFVVILLLLISLIIYYIRIRKE